MKRCTPRLNGTAFMGMQECVHGGDYVLYSDVKDFCGCTDIITCRRHGDWEHDAIIEKERLEKHINDLNEAQYQSEEFADKTIAQLIAERDSLQKANEIANNTISILFR